MQAIDFSSIGLSLVYFDSSVWRNKFKRGEGDASNPFRGCARFPRRAPVEIKAQLRRRLRSHPSTRATIETKLRPRAVQSLCLYFFFIFFLFFFTHAIPPRVSRWPVVISGPGCAKTRSSAHPSPFIFFSPFLVSLFFWIFYLIFLFTVEIDFCIAFFLTTVSFSIRHEETWTEAKLIGLMRGWKRGAEREWSVLQQWKLGFELIGLGGKSDWAFFFPWKKCVLFWIFFFFFWIGKSVEDEFYTRNFR